MIAKGQTFTGITIHLDGCTFTDCRFVRCEFVYSGFLVGTLSGCSFSDCQWSFTGPAQNTLALMRALYQVAPSLIDNTFDNIRGKAKPGGLGKLH
jgi:hypothetical protein